MSCVFSVAIARHKPVPPRTSHPATQQHRQNLLQPFLPTKMRDRFIGSEERPGTAGARLELRKTAMPLDP